MARLHCLFFLTCFFQLTLCADSVVIEWNQATLNAIISVKPPPPVAARALAMVHTSMYDAWAAYDSKAIGTRFDGLLRRPANERTDANKAQAISFAAFRTLMDLFPTQSVPFTNLMITLGYNSADTSTDIQTAVGIGNVVAENLLLFRHGDGSNQLANEPNTSAGPYSDYSEYVPVNTYNNLIDPSKWQPLTPTQIFTTPFWGLVTPFALESGNELRPTTAPATYPSRAYKEQALALMKFSAELNDTTKAIAEYWEDGSGTVTPPGHWNVIAQFISQQKYYGLDKDVKLFFSLNNALMDAGIACWDAKRFFNSVRPESAIRFLFQNKSIEAWGGPCLGTQSILGQNWISYLPTPSFPEYISGHSTFSAAAAEILRSFTKSDRYENSFVFVKGSSVIEPGCTPSEDVTLSWKTFTEAENQAGLSRRLGGIHFKDGDCHGRILGKKIGQRAYKRAQYFIHGG